MEPRGLRFLPTKSKFRDRAWGRQSSKQAQTLFIHVVVWSLLGPSKCEVERFAAINFGHPYIPRCHRNGGYQAVQCQTGGLCWCVDAQGREIPGTQQHGRPPSCGKFPLRVNVLPCSELVTVTVSSHRSLRSSLTNC